MKIKRIQFDTVDESMPEKPGHEIDQNHNF